MCLEANKEDTLELEKQMRSKNGKMILYKVYYIGPNGKLYPPCTGNGDSIEYGTVYSDRANKELCWDSSYKYSNREIAYVDRGIHVFTSLEKAEKYFYRKNCNCYKVECDVEDLIGCDFREGHAAFMKIRLLKPNIFVRIYKWFKYKQSSK